VCVFGLEQAASGSGTKVNVLVRPRGGDFCYSALELQAMVLDVAVREQTK